MDFLGFTYIIIGRPLSRTLMATRPTLTNSASQPIIIPPLTVDEEGQITNPRLKNSNSRSPADHVILERIHNNERAVTKILKKFHTYASLAHTPIVPAVNQPKDAHTLSRDDAREAFLTELATFELLIRKNAMACEAETRQVEEYQRERERLSTCSILSLVCMMVLITVFE